MLGSSSVAAVIAVKDIERAKEFYGRTLGLTAADEAQDGVYYQCGGGTRVFVYQSGYAGTNQATAVSWEVDDVSAEVKSLQQKGVTFEEYDSIPDVTRDGAVHRAEAIGITAAWFKDPDGNILNVVSRD
jgi:catechol 2,3-dioxygenase-like lactoylglutathione lyase family enzyme